MRPWLPALVLAALTGCQPADPPPAPDPVAMPEASAEGVRLRVLRGVATPDGWQVELSLQNDRAWAASGLRSVRRAARFHPDELMLVDADGARWPARQADAVTLSGLERNRRRITLSFDGGDDPAGLLWGGAFLAWPGAEAHSRTTDPLQRAADGLTSPEDAAALVRDEVGVVPAWGIRHSPATVWGLGRGTPVERAELLRALLGDLGWTSRLACGEHTEPVPAETIPPLPIPPEAPADHTAFDLSPAWCWAQVQQDGEWRDLDLRSDTSQPLPFLWETRDDASSHLWRLGLDVVALTRTGADTWESTSLWRQELTSAALSERTLVLDLQPEDGRLTARAWLVGTEDAQGRQASSVPLHGLERIVLQTRWTDPTAVLSGVEERTVWESAEAAGPAGPIRLGLSTSPGHGAAGEPHPFPSLASLHGRMGDQQRRSLDPDLPDPADPHLVVWQGSVSGSHIESRWWQPRPPLAATSNGPRVDLRLQVAFLDGLGRAHTLPGGFTRSPQDLVGVAGVDQQHRNEMMRGLGRGYSYAVTPHHDLWERHPTRGTWSWWDHAGETHPLPDGADDDPWVSVEQMLTQKRRVATKAPAAKAP